MSQFNVRNFMEKFEQEIRSLSVSDLSDDRKSKPCDIRFDTETNNDDDASGALEAAALEFFEQFNVVKTDFKNPCQGRLPFSEFKKDLARISGGVFKKVIKQGRGDVIDVEHSVITYEFAMFLEGSGAPFDSNFIQNHPGVTKAGAGILPGICQALSTMKIGEVADFWIHIDLMFGSKGCAPRVPPSADIMLHIKIKSVKQLQPSNEEPQEAEDLEHETPFTRDLKIAMKHYEKARSNYENGNYQNCIDVYRSLIIKMENVRLANEDDEKRQKKFLAKLYQNAAHCYVTAKRPEKACIMIRELERLQSIRDNAKALFSKGMANMMLLHYETARTCFIMAEVANPGSQKVIDALNELDNRKAAKLKFEEKSAKRQMEYELQKQQREQERISRIERRSREQQSHEAVVLEFGGELAKQIEDFKSETSIGLLSLTTTLQILSSRHLQVAVKLCRQHGIYLKGHQDVNGNQIHYYLSK